MIRKETTLPQFAILFKQWGKASDVARGFDCDTTIVLKAYAGNVAAYESLRNGTASRTGKKLNLYSCSFMKVNVDDRKKRPNWPYKMSHGMWNKITAIFNTATIGDEA